MVTRNLILFLACGLMIIAISGCATWETRSPNISVPVSQKIGTESIQAIMEDPTDLSMPFKEGDTITIHTKNKINIHTKNKNYVSSGNVDRLEILVKEANTTIVRGSIVEACCDYYVNEEVFGDVVEVKLEDIESIWVTVRKLTPLEYDSLETANLANESQRLDKENVSSANTIGPAAKKSKSISPVLGLNVASIDFEDDIFSGSGKIFGFTLGASFNSHYEIGYEYNSSAPLDSFFGDMFYSEPSLDKGRDLGAFEDAYLESQLLFLRGNWPISKKTTGFALVGYSKIELEIEKATFDCGPLFPIFPVCLKEDGLGSTTTYRNKESGIAWGAGLEWKRTPQSYLSLKYIDQSVDDFDFSGVYFSFGLRD